MQFKREPSYLIENMRPVTMLQTTYKSYTCLLDYHFKTEMEKCGLLEYAQSGFRARHQTHAPVIKVQYILQEIRQSKGVVYLAYLDWFSAFCSIDLPRLYLLMEALGMHTDDVNLIRKAHEGAWVLPLGPSSWGAH